MEAMEADLGEESRGDNGLGFRVLPGHTQACLPGSLMAPHSVRATVGKTEKLGSAQG